MYGWQEKLEPNSVGLKVENLVVAKFAINGQHGRNKNEKKKIDDSKTCLKDEINFQKTTFAKK